MGANKTVTVLRDAAGAARALSEPQWLLRVRRGPDRRKEKRRSGGAMIVGSGEGADLILTDATVSAVHCRVTADGSGFRVVDLGAKNGVRLGKHRIREAWLEAGDDIAIGNTIVRFELVGEDDERPLSERASLGRLVGASVAMRSLYSEIDRVAHSDATVLVRGETGTGKELVADAIVQLSSRRELPLEVVDCGRLTVELSESELFGHEEGAFTGAHRSHPGALERAGEGTLFLDEIGELPMPLQAKLLGVLERRAFTRVGGATVIPLRARVIAATHRDLAREVNEGRFRADLYYRLAVLELRVPALRERPDDIPALIAHFLEQLPQRRPLGAHELKALNEADYPGNVRELRSAVERAAIGLNPGVRPPASGVRVDVSKPYRLEKERVLEAFQYEYLRELLEVCGGNLSKASRQSGLDRMHLTEVVRRLGLASGSRGP